MKKNKIVIINILLFLLLVNVADFYTSVAHKYVSSFYKVYKGNKLVTYVKHYDKLHNFSIDSSKHLDNEYNNITAEDYDKKSVNSRLSYKFRPIENSDAKNSIVLFGCSFVQGYDLDDDETFSYNLGKLLPNYKIYNRAKGGWTTSQMLYQLEHKDFSEYKNVKYVIYVFMDDHIFRNVKPSPNAYTPYYKLNKDGSLSFISSSWRYIRCPLRIFVANYIHDNYIRTYRNSYVNHGNSKVLLTKKMIEESNRLVGEKFPDTKFIIFRYDDDDIEPYNWMFEKLKDEGMFVVSLDELSSKKFRHLNEYQLSPTDIHPNAKAWAEITPLFVKYLQNENCFKN